MKIVVNVTSQFRPQQHTLALELPDPPPGFAMSDRGLEWVTPPSGYGVKHLTGGRYLDRCNSVEFDEVVSGSRVRLTVTSSAILGQAVDWWRDCRIAIASARDRFWEAELRNTVRPDGYDYGDQFL